MVDPFLTKIFTSKMSDRGDRTFTFTCNNYTKFHEQALATCASNKCVVYLMYGYEVCPTTQTPHLQGFLRFKNARSFTATQKFLPAGLHIEIASQSPHRNFLYCSKTRPQDTEAGTIPNVIMEFGERPTPTGALKGRESKSFHIFIAFITPLQKVV